MKQTCWIDNNGNWLRDEPIEADNYQITSPLQIDLDAHPNPGGLYISKWNGAAWVEGGAAPPPPTPQPDPAKLIESLRGDPLFLKAIAAGAQGSSAVAMFLSLANAELKNPNFHLGDFEFSLKGLIQAMGSVTDDDRQQLNDKLKAANFSLQV